MNWFYSLNGKSLGPVEEEKIAELLKSKQIDGSTFVWQEAMTEWQPLQQTGLATLLTALQPVSSAPGTVCVNCGRAFASNEVIELGGRITCFECKPVVLRQLQENTADMLDVRFAGFWIRVSAAIIDGLLLWVVNLVAGLVIGLAAANNQTAILISANLLSILIGFLYPCIMLSKYGSTLGMMAVKIKVINADGTGPISFAKAAGRYLASILSGLILGIGYLMVAFDSQKRALHDHICSTRVIYK
ncbi:MAG: RDD family protein [Victivallaceae bacterium]